jgi:ABC-2 type transport system ATP-binding protein
MMIELKNVTKSYAGNIKAVENLTLNIEPGCVTGFLGPNGAGKTTTIKLITGILEADEGSITIGGYDIKTEDVNAKMCIGLVPDDPNAFLRLTGLEFLDFMADIYEVTHEDRLNRIESLSTRFEMKSALNDKIQSYSHGMRQKIMIIGSLLHDPLVWILDEPMTGLDPKSAFTLKQLMKEHAKSGKGVFFSTHVLEVAETTCDRIAVINKSRLVYAGNLADMKKTEHATLVDVFLEMTDHE